MTAASASRVSRSLLGGGDALQEGEHRAVERLGRVHVRHVPGIWQHDFARARNALGEDIRDRVEIRQVALPDDDQGRCHGLAQPCDRQRLQRRVGIVVAQAPTGIVSDYPFQPRLDLGEGARVGKERIGQPAGLRLGQGPSSPNR
jgi:hypothetical protein